MENESIQGSEAAVYEIGYLILPSIPEDNLSSVVDSIKGVVSKAGGQELDGEEPFKYDLAYPMSKTVGASRYVVSDAYLGWLKFEIEPSKVLAVKVGLDKLDELLRFLLIKAPRQSDFTFAKARAKMVEAEEKEEVGAPEEAVKEVVVE